ncbi:MAG: tetratricopeptide repeat protein [Caulobacterales bacterium]
MATTGLLFLPAAVLASGSGGAGASSMPMPSAPSEPQYDPVAEYQRGTTAFNAGQYKDAIRDFEHVTDAAPRAANGWYMLGLSKSQLGDAKGAEKAYERSEKLDGNSIATHRELALSLIKLKETDKAGAELAALKARAATCGDSCADAADLKAAIAAVEAALTPAAAPAPAASNAGPSSLSVASPQAGAGAYVRAVSLINEQRFSEALTALDAAEAAIGPHPDILTYKGYVWRRMGQWARAEDYYRRPWP